MYVSNHFAYIVCNLGILIPILQIKTIQLRSQIIRTPITSLCFSWNLKLNMSMTGLHNSFLFIRAFFWYMIICNKSYSILLSECLFTHYQHNFLFALRRPKLKIPSGIGGISIQTIWIRTMTHVTRKTQTSSALYGIQLSRVLTVHG